MLNFLNPFKLIGICILLAIILNLIMLPILFKNTSGGEQAPASFLMRSIYVTAYCVFFISLSSVFIYWSWTKKYWYALLPFLVLSWIYVFTDLISRAGSNYIIIEESKLINGIEIKVKKEFYSLNPNILRSQKFWKAGKKDSLWAIYDKTDKVLHSELYENDSLIR